MTDEYVYNPLDQSTYEVIAYNAIGRASEVNNFPAYGLVHSTGNSGWSVGFMQWDFGQPGRGEKADELLGLYQQSMPENQRFNEQELTSLSTRLRTRGQTDNALTQEEKSKLDTFLRSDDGRLFVGELNQSQVARKWQNVGQPLSEINWLNELGRTNPTEAAEIIAVTSKLYNQNEIRGQRLIDHLEMHELTSTQTSEWIGEQGINGLNQSAQSAIVSGRDKALIGIRLMNAMEVGDGQVSRLWRDEVHTNGNVELTANFNNSPASQLLDKMMRDPANGERVRAQLDDNTPPQRVVMTSTDETSRVELNAQRELTVRSPDGVSFGLTDHGWTRNGVLIQVVGEPTTTTQRQTVDTPDHIEPGRAQFAPMMDQRQQQNPVNQRNQHYRPEAPRNGPPEREGRDRQDPRNLQQPVPPDQNQRPEPNPRGGNAVLRNDAAHPGHREFQPMQAAVGTALSKADVNETPDTSRPSKSSQLNHPSSVDHPFHSLYSQATAHVQKEDERRGRTPDEYSERLALSATALAVENGITKIDHLVFSKENKERGIKAGENVVIVQGGFDDPAHNRADMKTEVAVNTPVEQSLRALDALYQRQAQEAHSLAQQPTQNPGQDPNTPRGPKLT